LDQKIMLIVSTEENNLFNPRCLRVMDMYLYWKCFCSILGYICYLKFDMVKVVLLGTEIPSVSVSFFSLYINVKCVLILVFIHPWIFLIADPMWPQQVEPHLFFVTRHKEEILLRMTHIIQPPFNVKIFEQ